jgi:hypothetical protein
MNAWKMLVLGLFLASVSFMSSTETLLVQQFNIGNIVVADNGTPQTITLDQFGTFQATPGFRIISKGQIGIYRLTNLPPSSTVNITVNVVNTPMRSDRPSLETFDFEIVRQEETVLSDADGEAELRFGGRITTSGSGLVLFTDTDYTSQIRIIVNI